MALLSKRVWLFPFPVDNNSTFNSQDNYSKVIEFVCNEGSDAEWTFPLQIPSNAVEIKRILLYYRIIQAGSVNFLTTILQKISFQDDTPAPSVSLISHNVSGFNVDSFNSYQIAIIVPSSPWLVNQLKSQSSNGELNLFGISASCSSSQGFKMNISGYEIEYI